MENKPGSENKNSFDQKKTKYFANLAQKLASAFKVHRNEGNLWEEKNGIRDWGNVSEHCLVEVARVKVLGDLLNLSPDIVKDLQYAAALHDFSKKKEKELEVPEGGITWDQYEKEISKYSVQTIQKNGFNNKIAELAESVGHGSLLNVEEILKNSDNLNQDQIAYLVMHYVDNYTRGSKWVEPSDGTTNEIDARIEKDRHNPTLKNLQEEGKNILGGRNYTDVMEETGHTIEKLFSKIIAKNKELDLDPLKIPEYVDEIIKREITNLQ